MAAVPAQPPALPAGAEAEGGGGARAGGEGVVAVTPDRGSKWHGEVQPRHPPSTCRSPVP